mgnify:FL=1
MSFDINAYIVHQAVKRIFVVKHDYVAFKAGNSLSFVITDLNLPTQYYLVATVRNHESSNLIAISLIDCIVPFY